MLEQNKRPVPVPGRPQLKDYGIDVASTEGLLTWEWLSEQMDKARNYWVATTRPDGKPHAMPVWGVWLNEVFYFSTARSSRKGRNLEANPELVVHLESGDNVVIFEGTVEEAFDVAFLARFADAYEIKYQFRPDTQDLKNVTYALQPHTVYAWLESDFTKSATRWKFD